MLKRVNTYDTMQSPTHEQLPPGEISQNTESIHQTEHQTTILVNYLTRTTGSVIGLTLRNQ